MHSVIALIVVNLYVACTVSALNLPLSLTSF